MKKSAAGVALTGILFVVMFLSFAAPDVALAMDPVKIPLGTLAPSGSSFYSALAEMRDAWKNASGGAVNLNIYADGVQGSESQMVQMMRAHSLAAGLLTVVGLSEIDTSVGGLSFLPLTFHSWEEYDYVVEKMSPRLERVLLDKGFVVLFWADAGWIHFFSKAPAIHPDDFKPLKMFTWAGNAYQVDLMKALGYHPVPLETADILPGLRRNLINAIPVPSNQALLGQFYTVANQMLNLKWSVLSGAAVVRKDVWDKIPQEMQAKLRGAALAAGAKIRASSRKEDEDSIAAMQKRGLVVHPVTPQVEEEWMKLTKVIYPELRGKTIPADIFDEVQRLVAEYRTKGSTK
jgi:TRAP-type C4-dicarboxylate transport system substrate-binding protein